VNKHLKRMALISFNATHICQAGGDSSKQMRLLLHLFALNFGEIYENLFPILAASKIERIKDVQLCAKFIIRTHKQQREKANGGAHLYTRMYKMLLAAPPEGERERNKHRVRAII
jgi:hypothetical protein